MTMDNRIIAFWPVAKSSQGQKEHGSHRQNSEGEMEPIGPKERLIMTLASWGRRGLTFPATEASWVSMSGTGKGNDPESQ